MDLHGLKSSRLYVLAGIVLLGLATLPGMSLYYQWSGGRACARCHEIWQPYEKWQTSTHRAVRCTDCHGDVLTLEAGFHLGNIRRLLTHLRGTTPERVRLKNAELWRTLERCETCHRQEFADWRAGPHGATYARLFLDETHNRKRLLMDDCLRCHGMHFEGSIGDLVAPVNTEGPWRLRVPELGERPAMPCFSCHRLHGEGRPLERHLPESRPRAATEELHRPSLAIFDRRPLEHVETARLPLPAMREGTRSVRMSPDPRQALCHQCHAPEAGFQVASGDDRTPIGVHEGLSCLACHHRHRQTTRASCATCHPQLSNCGLDVEEMDTTFRDPQSRHNIHFVKCADCHPKGVPERERLRAAR
jgi:hypothetical protein